MKIRTLRYITLGQFLVGLMVNNALDFDCKILYSHVLDSCRLFQRPHCEE